jgi:hypothetical protein
MLWLPWQRRRTAWSQEALAEEATKQPTDVSLRGGMDDRSIPPQITVTKSLKVDFILTSFIIAR